MKLSQETWAATREEALPLMKAHWDELGYGFDFDFNEPYIEAIEAAGVLRAYTLRIDGALVGYAAFTLMPSMQSRKMLEAQEIGVFVHRGHRGRASIALMSFAEQRLEHDGADQIFYHSPMANPAFGSLLERRGFKKVDEVFARRM